MPRKYKTYYEPFLGGGALFFASQPKAAILSDSNEELIQCYKQISYRPHKVIESLKGMKYDKDQYMQIRETIPTNPVEKASRFIYLNRCCWNGLYRVNSKGEFNVPFGNYSNPTFYNEKNIISVSRSLGNVKLLSVDFEECLSETKKGDFVYVDPPYTVKHGNNGFILYNEKIFSWDDQVRLANLVRKLAKKNVQVMVSNANVKEIEELYNDFEIHTVSRASVISGKVTGRGRVKELIITTYKSSNLGDWV